MSHQQTSPNPDSPQLTQPVLLVVWGLYAQRMGLIQALTKVKLKQKSYTHRPQTKVLEFLVALLAGLPHLQDISQAAHPLVKDQAVAQACLATTWQPVGRNASLAAWPAITVDAFTYPLTRLWSARCHYEPSTFTTIVTGSVVYRCGKFP